jgi:hypothetical protein
MDIKQNPGLLELNLLAVSATNRIYIEIEYTIWIY